MGQWGSDVKQLTPFETAVRWLSPEAKKAMYAAAAGNLIKRNTWNGCAFNQGGLEIGNPRVQSVEAAAEAFNLPLKSVINFINQWDSLGGTDEQCTQLLRDTIQKIGIFSPRGAVRLVNLKIFSSTMEQEKMEKELDEIISSGKADTIDWATEAAELLSMCNA